jgi:hypothetical protein
MEAAYMMSFRWYEGFPVVAVLAVACGGSGSSVNLTGGGDGAAGGDDTADSSGRGDAIAIADSPAQPSGDAGDGAASTLDANGAVPDADDGASSMQDAASDAPEAACPDVHGAYAIVAIDATGCGASLNTSAPECITQSACGITFQSNGSGGANRAINGDAMLGGKGNFLGAALKEGDLNRTGCTGSWNAANSTMTVDCGGTGSLQACVLAVHRTSSACN